MAEPKPILVPLVNPNEPAALLAELDISAGQFVRAGDKLCTLETTKSTLELMAETEGFVAGLRVEQGKTVNAGDILCYLAGTPDWSPVELEAEPTQPAVPTGLRVSQSAYQLAQLHSLDLSQLPGDAFITEKMVQTLIDGAIKPKPAILKRIYEPNSIIVYGGGGHGKALIELIQALGVYDIIGVVDDGIPAGTMILGLPVLGGAGVLEQLYENGIQLAANAVGGIGNIETRIKVFDRISQVGFNCPKLTHPTAFIEASATLSDGVQVMPHAYVGSEARIGFGAIINTGAIVSHDCTLGACSNLSPGAILAGEVSIGEAVLVGMGATINLQVKIGNRARVGNGATVKQDVPEGSIVHAGTVWPR